MRTTSLQKLVELQRKPENIRNICILAHVDHGKTTLADSLVASNGIISQRMAGKLRYMDNTEDEQLRGITMKSSAISLSFEKDQKDYLINLIDSPGHVDFSSEVSTAVRLCDGAIVVVDVVEGVCPQTHAVLRQAWLENIKLVLVLNKVDRLILELKMEPLEAFFHLQQILEQVNIVTNELFTVDMMEKTESNEWTTVDDDDEEEKNNYFSPDRGNVIFASAYDGWGFTVEHFAKIFSTKLGIKEEVLKKTLWGDFYLSTKNKKIMKGAQSKVKKPLFVQFILDNIWNMYDCICVQRDKEKMQKILTTLNLKIDPRDARNNDPRVKLQAIISQWLPISPAVLGLAVNKLPSPLNISEERAEKLMCSKSQTFNSFPKATQDLKKDFLSCSCGQDVPVIVFVSKMFPVHKSALPQYKPVSTVYTEAELQQRREQARQRHREKMAALENQNIAVEGEKVEEVPNNNATKDLSVSASNEELTQKDEKESKEPEHRFVAFARVFSGTVKKGKRMFVLGPKHDPDKMASLSEEQIEGVLKSSVRELEHDYHMTTFVTNELYLFMGRDLELMDEIPAGNILGIGGLEEHVLKSATLSSTVMCPAFTDLYFDAVPIVRVALEPAYTADMKNLVEGLKLLNQADPCVQVLVQETGEHVIITAGEVHLQRCLDDLRKTYAKVEIIVSDPIVPFRETIIPPPKVDMVNEVIQEQRSNVKPKNYEDDEEVIEAGLIHTCTANRKCQVIIRAVPLPEGVTKVLEDNSDLLRTLYEWSAPKSELSDSHASMKGSVLDHIMELKTKLQTEFEEAEGDWNDVLENIWSFGPRRVGPNILVNRIPDYTRTNVWDFSCRDKNLKDFDNSFVSGFQIATLAGPLCEEPMRGVCFMIEKWEYTDSSYARVARQSESENEAIDGSDGGQDLNIDLKEKLSLASNNNEDSDGKEKVGGEHVDSCDEDVQAEVNQNKPQLKREAYGPFSGQLISCVKDGCRKAFQTQPQRLMVAMYKCNIQATSDVLGKLYAVLGQRHGSIIEGDMKEGSQSFNVVATLPVIESFGFTDVIRKKTSGLASPQLFFSHWELLDVDPFWVPTTEEEYLHFGEKADSANRALRYMNMVRKRKGLKVDEKIVEHAEKQRTLTKMK